jgi:hypothetical protein
MEGFLSLQYYYAKIGNKKNFLVAQQLLTITQNLFKIEFIKKKQRGRSDFNEIVLYKSRRKSCES